MTTDDTPHDVPAAPGARLTDVAGDVRGLHGRLLSWLDADAAMMERQVLASLRALERKLGRPPVLGQRHAPDYVSNAARHWADDTERRLRQHAVHTRESAADLLSRLDWGLVNQVVPHPGGHRYPEVILDVLEPREASLPAGVMSADASLPSASADPAVPAASGAAADTPAAAVLASAVPAPRTAPERITAIRSVHGGVLVTAGIGAAVLGLLRLPLLKVAGAAALGVIGGSVYEARQRAGEQREQALRLATASIPVLCANVANATQAALREQAAARRMAVDERFTLLECALAERAAAALPASREEAG
jgi:hypothetical protein